MIDWLLCKKNKGDTPKLPVQAVRCSSSCFPASIFFGEVFLNSVQESYGDLSPDWFNSNYTIRCKKANNIYHQHVLEHWLIDKVSIKAQTY